MAKIDTILAGDNSFIKVRKRIASILADEFANQKVLINAYKTANHTLDHANLDFILSCIPSKIYDERMTRFNEDELYPNTCMNIMFSTNPPSDVISVSHQIGMAYFAIEGWAKSKATAENASGQMSFYRLHKMMGMASAILMNPVYRFLGFEGAGCIVGRHDATEITIQNPEYGAESASFMAVGSFFDKVKIIDKHESSTLTGLIAGIDTNMKTDKYGNTYFETTF